MDLSNRNEELSGAKVISRRLLDDGKTLEANLAEVVRKVTSLSGLHQRQPGL